MDCTGSIHKGIYNCFGERDEGLCYDCIHNPGSQADKKQDKFVSQRDKVDELYKFLKGEKLPEGTQCKMPKLSASMAFNVIWFLQELSHVLPDNIEQCRACKVLFDADSEGFYLDDQYINTKTGKTLAKKYWGHWCDDCVPHIDFEVK